MQAIKKLLVPLCCFFTCATFNGCSKSDDTTPLPTISDANNKSVGAAANDLLSSSKYTSVKIELQYMPGFVPDAAAVNNVTAFLNSLLNKPVGITVSQVVIASSGKQVLNLNDVALIEKNNRTVFTTGSQLGMYLLITDGKYSEANVLGFVYRNTSMCLLGKTVHDNSGSIGQASRTKLETTVLEHEFAHLLGLVDIGSTMQTNHKDAAHGNHCNNNNCLMYYTAETTDVLGFLITGSIPTLDANCIADLRANGAK